MKEKNNNLPGWCSIRKGELSFSFFNPSVLSWPCPLRTVEDKSFTSSN